MIIAFVFTLHDSRRTRISLAKSAQVLKESEVSWLNRLTKLQFSSTAVQKTKINANCIHTTRRASDYGGAGPDCADADADSGADADGDGDVDVGADVEVDG